MYAYNDTCMNNYTCLTQAIAAEAFLAQAILGPSHFKETESKPSAEAILAQAILGPSHFKETE